MKARPGPRASLGAAEPPAGVRSLGMKHANLLERAFEALALVATLAGLVVLATLLINVFIDGIPYLSWDFIAHYPSRRPAEAGILSALVGTIWMLCVTAAVAFPIGVGSAIYLEEYAKDSKFSQFIEINIANLAGVPSIIYGLLGLEIFVRIMMPVTGGRSVLAGSLTMSLLILPIIIVTTREAIRTVPSGQRDAGYALGATRWQAIWGIVLPLALPGSMTGAILALSRAIGETAPLIMIGALTYIAFLPDVGPGGLQSQFTVLPIQIFNWVSRPQAAFHHLAAAGIILLLAVLLAMNSVAIYLRQKLQRRNF